MRNINIVVTTPRGKMRLAEREAAECLARDGGHYFRRFYRRPKLLEKGMKIFYVENGYVRGFGEVSQVSYRGHTGMECESTGHVYGKGVYAIMAAKTWQWIKPIPMKGFQGWRYFDKTYEVVGGWKDPKPELVIE